jgi:hypothetical protein
VGFVLQLKHARDIAKEGGISLDERRPRPPVAYDFAAALLHAHMLDLIGAVDNDFKFGRQVVLPKVLSVEDDLVPLIEAERLERIGQQGVPTTPVGSDVVYRVLRSDP